MALDASNSQFGADVEHKTLDRGTPAWAVKPGPAAVPAIPLVPGSTVFSEDFEGPLWTQIFLVSTEWATTTLDSHSPITSYRGNAKSGVGLATSFTINDFSFSPQLSFWYKFITPFNSGATFEVLFDGTPVFSVTNNPVSVWTRVAIPTNFAFNITFRFVNSSILNNNRFALVDDIVFGSLDTPAVPGAPAHPLIYTPLHLDSDNNLKVTVIDGTVAVTGTVETRQLTCETDSVTACIDDVVTVSGSVSIEDPISVTGVVNTRALDCDTDSVTVCIDEPLDVNVTNVSPISVTFPRLNCATDSVEICNDAGSPITVNVNNTITVVPGRRSLRGLYYATSGAIAYTTAADAATGGDLWIVNTSPTVIAYIREVRFTSNIAALALLTALPRIHMERITFTGTPSGAQITPARRDSTDLANTATVRTANTGMTITAGAVIKSFSPPSSDLIGGLLAANATSAVPVEQIFLGDLDSYIVLRQNQGVVFRQATGGSLTENRVYQIDFNWEEI